MVIHGMETPQFSSAARRALDYMLAAENYFYPMSQARNNPVGTDELLDKMMIVPFDWNSLNGYKLTQMAIKVLQLEPTSV